MRPGAAHCDLEFPGEVRRCTLRSGEDDGEDDGEDEERKAENEEEMEKKKEKDENAGRQLT